MISHERRAVFVHIPKTAGTSVEVALGHYGPDGRIVRDGQDHRTLRQLRWPHVRPGELTSGANAAEALRAVKAQLSAPSHEANRTRLSRAQYASYLKFAVVRNPWSRTWSWYRNVMSDPLHRARLGVGSEVGFAEFVRRQIGVDCLRDQLYWLRDFDRKVGVDVVCRYESLDRDWAALCARGGWGELPLPTANAGTAGADVRDAYDAPTRRLVADRFGEEIELFGYRFDTAV